MWFFSLPIDRTHDGIGHCSNQNVGAFMYAKGLEEVEVVRCSPSTSFVALSLRAS